MRVNTNNNELYCVTSIDARTLNTVMFLFGNITGDLCNTHFLTKRK